MENYARIIMEYMEESFPGVIVSWDVVNEAIDDSTGELRDSNWTRIVGDDFVLQAFRFARKYAPAGTLLYYNDYSTPCPPKPNGILELPDELTAVNLVDGYGFQCHYQLDMPTIAQFENAVQKIADKNPRIRVSKMDILVDSNTGEQFQKQADRYKALTEVLLQYADQAEAVQTWGTRDSLSWKSGRYPLLFNSDGTPKPAFLALTDPDILP
jgi:endo-1,4-beta-xylanase